MTKVEAPKVKKKTDTKAVSTVDDREIKYEDIKDEQKNKFTKLQEL